MPDQKQCATLVELYRRRCAEFRQSQPGRGCILLNSRWPFTCGYSSVLNLFPRTHRRFSFYTPPADQTQAIAHDWFAVGGDLFATYLKCTIDSEHEHLPADQSESVGSASSK